MSTYRYKYCVTCKTIVRKYHECYTGKRIIESSEHLGTTDNLVAQLMEITRGKGT